MNGLRKEAAAAKEALGARVAPGEQAASGGQTVRNALAFGSAGMQVAPGEQAPHDAAGTQTAPNSISELVREGSALSQALDISCYAVSCGFEWRDVQGVWEKVYEEIDEFKEATTEHDKELEFGDILFSLVNIARWSGVDPEAALLATCEKFRCRWSFMEAEAKEKGQALDTLGPEKLMELWRNAKRLERGSNQLNS